MRNIMTRSYFQCLKSRWDETPIILYPIPPQPQLNTFFTMVRVVFNGIYIMAILANLGTAIMGNGLYGKRPF